MLSFNIICRLLFFAMNIMELQTMWSGHKWNIIWKSNVTFYRVFLSVPSPVNIWFLFHPYWFAISFPMSGLPFLWVNWFYKNLKKNCQKSWRTWVRTDKSSTFRRFELMSVRTNVLTPLKQPWIFLETPLKLPRKTLENSLKRGQDISSNGH